MENILEEINLEEAEKPDEDPEVEDLRPKPPEKRAAKGIRTFTVYRKTDESGVSGNGIVIEGAAFATGQCVVHWLYPPPKGSVAIFDSMDDFIKVHITPHPANQTIITFQDGETIKFGDVEDKKET